MSIYTLLISGLINEVPFLYYVENDGLAHMVRFFVVVEPKYRF